MRVLLVILGAALTLAGAGAWVYVTAAAEGCDTTGGQLGQALDPDVQGQCALAQRIILGALVGIGLGVVLTVVGILVRDQPAA